MYDFKQDPWGSSSQMQGTYDSHTATPRISQPPASPFSNSSGETVIGEAPASPYYYGIPPKAEARGLGVWEENEMQAARHDGGRRGDARGEGERRSHEERQRNREGRRRVEEERRRMEAERKRMEEARRRLEKERMLIEREEQEEKEQREERKKRKEKERKRNERLLFVKRGGDVTIERGKKLRR